MIKLDFNLLINIINILVLCWLLKKFLIKPVLNVMQKREEIINNGLENARTSEQKANELKIQYDEKLKKADDEAKDIIASSKENADRHFQEMVNAANQQARQIVDNAHKTAELEQKKAIEEAKAHIAELACDMVNKISIENNENNKNLAAYDQFIKEVGDGDDDK